MRATFAYNIMFLPALYQRTYIIIITTTELVLKQELLKIKYTVPWISCEVVLRLSAAQVG